MLVCVCVCMRYQIGTGFKENQLEQHAEFFKDHLLDGPKPYYRYNEGTQPDQWFNSVQVNTHTHTHTLYYALCACSHTYKVAHMKYQYWL